MIDKIDSDSYEFLSTNYKLQEKKIGFDEDVILVVASKVLNPNKNIQITISQSLSQELAKIVRKMYMVVRLKKTIPLRQYQRFGMIMDIMYGPQKKSKYKKPY